MLSFQQTNKQFTTFSQRSEVKESVDMNLGSQDKPLHVSAAMPANPFIKDAKLDFTMNLLSSPAISLSSSSFNLLPTPMAYVIIPALLLTLASAPIP